MAKQRKLRELTLGQKLLTKYEPMGGDLWGDPPCRRLPSGEDLMQLLGSVYIPPVTAEDVEEIKRKLSETERYRSQQQYL